METIIEKILYDAKIAYKESVKIENNTLEEHLLSIIGNAQSILNKKSIPKQKNITNTDNNQESNEVQKVYRKVPRWLKNRNPQVNPTKLPLSKITKHQKSQKFLYLLPQISPL